LASASNDGNEHHAYPVLSNTGQNHTRLIAGDGLRVRYRSEKVYVAGIRQIDGERDARGRDEQRAESRDRRRARSCQILPVRSADATALTAMTTVSAVTIIRRTTL
jgi:hypothetical protein